MQLFNAATDPRGAGLRQNARDYLLSMPRYGPKHPVYGKRVRRLERDWIVNGAAFADVDAAVTELLKPTH